MARALLQLFEPVSAMSAGVETAETHAPAADLVRNQWMTAGGESMVTYEYTCQACGKQFQQQEHISEHSPTPRCPECNSEKVEQLHSAVYVKTSKKS